MDQKYLDAKNYNLAPDLKLNDYVDAKDTVNHWCVANIIDIDDEKNSIKVHFEGWTHRYDEWIKKNAVNKLAPFRRHTEGYTGQKKNAYRDWNMSYTQHNDMTKQVKDLIESDFKCIDSPYKMTQFVRGQLYFYVDSIISLFNNNISSEDLPAIADFISEVFILILKWMSIFPKYLDSFYANQKHPNLFLVDIDAAIAMCGSELFGLFEKVFGLCQRCIKFFQRFSNEYIIEGEFANREKIKGNGLMLSFLNQLGNLQGFREIIDFIRFEKKDSKGKFYKACPLILTMKALRPFVSVLEMCEKAFVIQFTDNVKTSIIDRIDNLTDNEIKELDKEILKDTIEVLKNYINILEPQESHKIGELKELYLANKYLRCHFFEKRVRGINDLKDIFYKVNNGQNKSRVQIENQNLECTRWLTFDRYSQWLIQEKIVEFIFQEFPHVELIKRSLEILRLLAFGESTFSPDYIDMMWGCCKEKHEDIVRATYDIIQELAMILPLERLSQLFSKVMSVKESEYDEKSVIFLKNYTLNVLRNLRNYKKNENKQGSYINNFLNKKRDMKIDEAKFYDLTKLWMIFQDQNKVPQKVKDLALNSLIDIIQDINEKDMKESFINLAVENIKRGDTFLFSLIFLKKLLNIYPLDSQIKFRPGPNVVSVSQILLEIGKKNDIFDLIFRNTEQYMRQKKQLQTQMTHEEYIKVIFRFIEFVLTNSKIQLTYNHVEHMFGMFVRNALTDMETNQFFMLLTKENDQAKSSTRRFLLDDRVRNEVFAKIFCNKDVIIAEKMNMHGFLSFKKLFLIINEEEKFLEIQRDEKVIVNNLNSLLGIESLWPIAIQCQTQIVKESCRDFLVDLYLKAKTKSNIQKRQIIDLFIDKCLGYFQSPTDISSHQLSCLRLIKTFINRFDGDHILEEDMSQYNERDTKIIQVTLHPEKVTEAIKVNTNQKLWQLKRKMASTFKLRLSEFYIKTKQGPLDEASYNEPIREYTIQSIHIQKVSQEEMDKEFPRYLIGNNQDYLYIFIDLLHNGNEVTRIEVLSLLQILPINIKIRDYLKENISQYTSETKIIEWNKLMGINEGMSDLSKTLYFLMTLENLIIPKRDILNQEAMLQEKQIKSDFCLKLISKNGFQFLTTLYQQLDKQNLDKDILKQKTLGLLLKLICHLFQLKQFQTLRAQLNQKDIEKLVSESLKLWDNYIKIAFSQQKSYNQLSPELQAQTPLLVNEDGMLQDAFTFMIRAFNSYPQCLSTFYDYQGLDNMIRISLIDLHSDYIKKIVSQSLASFIVQLENNSGAVIKPSFYFMNLFIKNCLEYALDKGTKKTKTFFDLLNLILTNTEIYKVLGQIQPVPALVSYLCKIIFERGIIEDSAREEDVSLSGIFVMLRNVLEKFPDIRTDFKEKNSLLQYLIHEGLFHKETKGSALILKSRPSHPVCKNQLTRENCLKLLNILCLENQSGMHVLIRYLKNYISETFWRGNRKADWSITVHQQERSLTGYVGLKNIGCICYMNSIMQQLYMIPTFRKAILEVEDSNFLNTNPDENPLRQMKMIFGGLMEMEKQYYNPKKFCSSFKDIDGSPIDPMVQRDVDEFFNMLIDRIENLIKGKKEEKMIQNLFQGVFANEFICKGCPHYSEREEPFLAISLQVKNKHSIKESLDSFVEGEMLEGDNAYWCEKCEKKINTLKRCCIKRMPNVLFLVLKRFEFNFDTMTKFKVNDYCEFPMNLNMKNYSQENLTKNDLRKEMEDRNLTFEDLNEEQRQILSKEIPEKYYQYNLKGTVIHLGTADQGHYYSFIQDREHNNGKWFEFNDIYVKDFDPSDIPYETFGGDDENIVNEMQSSHRYGGNYDPAMVHAIKQYKTKIKNAYILIYERDDILDMEKFNEFMDHPQINTVKEDMKMKYEQCKLPKTVSSQIQIPPYIHDQILVKNKKFWLSKFIFNKVYIESVLNIFKQIPIQTDHSYSKARKEDLQTLQDGQFEMFKFLTTFFLTTVIRAKERKSVPFFMKIIREALQKNVLLSVWLIETFSNQDIIKELIIDSPIHDMKRFAAGLLKTAMEAVYPFEENHIQEYCQALDSDPIEYIQQTQGPYVKSIKTIDARSISKTDSSVNGMCSELQLVTLSHHNDRLPILVMIMNSFLHQSVSQHNQKQQMLTAQFYMVFSHFAELGVQTRQYLLKTKTLGRLLELLFNQQNTSFKFKNEFMKKIPLFQLTKPLYIETNIKKTEAPISEIEKKTVIFTQTHYSLFLVYTISILARSTLFVKSSTRSPYSNDDINYIGDPEEISMITNVQSDSFWSACKQKVARNAIADMFAHMSYENKEFSFQYMMTLLKIYSNSKFQEMKLYEKPLLRFFQIQDNYQTDRIKRGLSELFTIMKSNLQFYKYIDSFIDFIYKCALRCPQVCEFLSKNAQYYRQIDQYTKENPHFPLNQSKSKIFKQGIVQWNNQKSLVNQTILDKVTQYSKERQQKLQVLLQKQTTMVDSTYDSDDDYYKQQLSEKDRIDFMDHNDNWYTGHIDICLDEMVKCISDHAVSSNNNQPISFWIETESDKLAPPNTMVSNEKRKWNGFYVNLLKQVQ